MDLSLQVFLHMAYELLGVLFYVQLSNVIFITLITHESSFQIEQHRCTIANRIPRRFHYFQFGLLDYIPQGE